MFARKATSVAEKLAHYASFPQTPVSLHQMIAFGQDPSPGKVLRAAKFLADEFPIRLAHRIRDIDNSALGQTPSFATVRKWYLQSFEVLISLFPPVSVHLTPAKEISSFPTIKLPPSTQRIFLPTATPNPFNSPAAPLGRETGGSQRRFYVSPTTDRSWTPELLELNSQFIKVLQGVRKRHDSTVYRVAYGVREFLRKSGGNGAQGADEELHDWLDRFYVSRLSMRFLIGQHMAISSPQPPPPHHVGIINEQTDIASVLKDAINKASSVCEEYYALHRAPRIVLNCPSSLRFAYVPGHLNHIAFEILKNSLRATVEKTLASDDEKFPEIRIDVIELPATDQIAIRVSDQG
ncbi:unnamed protein product, partial [Rhizoctonia solani]